MEDNNAERVAAYAVDLAEQHGPSSVEVRGFLAGAVRRFDGDDDAAVLTHHLAQSPTGTRVIDAVLGEWARLAT